MQSSRLIVKNFGPLKDIDIEVRDFLCLIGKQATGKSTIAKLIAIFEDENFSQYFFIQTLMDYGLYDFLNKESYISYKIDDDKESIFYFDFTYMEGKATLRNFKSIFGNYFEAKSIKNFQDLDGKIDLIRDISIHAIDVFKKLNYKKEIIEINKLISYYVNENNIIRSENSIIKKEIDYYIQNKEKIDVNYYNQKLDFIEQSLLKLTNELYDKLIEFIKFDSQYIPSERNFLHIIAENTLGLINNNVQIPKHLLEIGQEYEKALNKVKEVPLNLIDKKFTYKREGKTSYIYHNQIEKIDLLQSASGLQSIIPIILLVEYAKTLKENYHFNFVIEEPELNIYPHTQHQLIKYLVKNIFDFKVKNYQRKKMVITTHSPYILASINNLLLAFQKGQENPKQVNKVIRKESWINPTNFNAYELKNGKSYKILDEKLGQIKSNMIDKVSDEFSDEFDKLLAI